MAGGANETYYPPAAFYFNVQVLASGSASSDLTNADASFQEVSGITAALTTEGNTNSPDLSQVMTVNAGDTLPLMCYEVCGSSTSSPEPQFVLNKILYGMPLCDADGRWQLLVQRKTVDVLVDQVPWSIRVFAAGWTQQPVYVRW